MEFKNVKFPKKVLVYIFLLVALIMLSQPGNILFLPESVRQWIGRYTSIVFGNVGNFSISIDFARVFSLIILVLVLLSIKEILGFILSRIEPKSRRHQTLLTLGKSVLRYLITLIGVLWAIGIMGVDISTIFASVSVLALIVGFGAESLIADMVTGIFLLFENHYNVGDIIEVDGFRGEVVEIGIRTTSIRNAGGNKMIVNNSKLQNVISMSGQVSSAVSDISISYESSLEEVERHIPSILEKIFGDNQEIFMETPVYLGVQELAADGVVLRFVAKADESNVFSARRIMNRRLLLEFARCGFKIPYPQLELHKGADIE